MNFNPYKMFRDLFVAVNMCVDFLSSAWNCFWRKYMQRWWTKGVMNSRDISCDWMIKYFSYIQRLGVSYAKNTLKHCLKE